MSVCAKCSVLYQTAAGPLPLFELLWLFEAAPLLVACFLCVHVMSTLVSSQGVRTSSGDNICVFSSAPRAVVTLLPAPLHSDGAGGQLGHSTEAIVAAGTTLVSL